MSQISYACNSYFTRNVRAEDCIIQEQPGGTWYAAYHTLVVRRTRECDGRDPRPAKVEIFGSGGGRYAHVSLGVERLRALAAGAAALADELEAEAQERAAEREAEAAEWAEAAADWASLPVGFPGSDAL